MDDIRRRWGIRGDPEYDPHYDPRRQGLRPTPDSTGKHDPDEIERVRKRTEKRLREWRQKRSAVSRDG